MVADRPCRAGARAATRVCQVDAPPALGRAQRGAVRVADGRRARPRGHACRPASARSARSRRACTRTRARWPRAGRLPALRAGTTTPRSAPPATGAAGRTGSGIGADELALLDRLDAHDPRAARAPTAGAATASAWCTPTSASPTCWSTASDVRVIDFDDCGFVVVHVRLRDHRSASSRTTRRCPSCSDAWVEGYRSVAPLAAADEAELRHLRDAAPAAAGGLDRLAPQFATRGRRARRRASPTARASSPSATCPLTPDRHVSQEEPHDVHPDQPAAPCSSPAAPRASARASRAVFASAGRNVVITGRDADGGEAAARDLSGRRRRRVVRRAATSPRADDCAARGRRGGRAARRPRRALRQRRHLPRRAADGDDRAATSTRSSPPTSRAHAQRAGGAAALCERSGHGRVILTSLDHRADHRLPRLVALRRDQGGPARLPAHAPRSSSRRSGSR